MESAIMANITFSIVIPVYRSENSIGPLVNQIFEVLSDKKLEIILVDDASDDNSAKVCRQLANNFPGKVKFVQLARNFGEHNATMAGLSHTKGQYVLVMDDDFQNPPEAALSLFQKIQSGDFDVVYSKYDHKKHKLWRNFGSWTHNLVATFLLGKPYELYLSSFKVMSRFAVNQILNYQGPFPYIDGLLLQSVSKIGSTVVPHHDRNIGKSSYTLFRLLSLWLNAFTNFSIVPLRAAFLIGLFGFLVGTGIIVLLIYERFSHYGLPTGYLMLMTTSLFLSSSILVVVGLVGEYLGRILLNINGKPQYVVREVIDIENKDSNDLP